MSWDDYEYMMKGGPDVLTESYVFTPDPGPIARDVWGNPVSRDAWQGSAEQLSKALAPSLSLGKSSLGSKLGGISIYGDIIGKAVTDPLKVEHVVKLIPNSSALTDVQSVKELIPDTNPALYKEQHISQDTVIEVRETPLGGLRIFAFRLSDTTPVSGEIIREVPNDGMAVTDIIAYRDVVDGDLGVRVEGTYLGKPYETAFGMSDGAAGYTSVKEENGVRVSVVDAEVPDAADHDGNARQRSITTRRRDPKSQGNWVIVEQRMAQSRTLADGREILLEDILTGANNELLVTTYTYDEVEEVNGQANKTYGHLMSKTNPDGSWVRYQYDTEGNLELTFTPWLDSPATAAEATEQNCRVERVISGEFDDETGEVSQSREISILGVVVSTQWTEYQLMATGFERRDISELRRLNSNGAVVSYQQIRRSWYEILPDKTKRMTRSISPSNAHTIYQQQVGSLSNAGVFTEEVGGSHRAYYTWFDLQGTESVAGNTEAGHTIRTIRYEDQAGSVVREEKAFATNSTAYNSANYQTFDGSIYDYDDAKGHMLVQRKLLDGTVLDSYDRADVVEGGVTVGYTLTHTDAEGNIEIKQVHANDEVKRVLRPAVTAGFQWHFLDRYNTVTIEHDVSATMDAIGRETEVSSIEGQLNVALYTTKTDDEVSSRSDWRVVDAAGRTLQSGMAIVGIPSDRIRMFGYSLGGRQVTETLPGGLTHVTTRHRDGQLQNITGTSVVPEHHGYEVNADGTITETTWVESVSSTRWKKIVRDFAGTVLKEISPDPANPSQSVTVRYYHDNEGRVIRVNRPELADEITTYRANGEIYQSGLDMNESGSLELSSTDTITEYDREFESYSGSNNTTRVRQVSRASVFTQGGGGNGVAETVTRTDMGRGAAGYTTVTAPDGTVTTITKSNDRSKGISTVVTERPDRPTITEVQVAGRTLIRHDPAANLVATTDYGMGGVAKTRTRQELDGGQLQTFGASTDALGQPAQRWNNGILAQTYSYYADNEKNAGKVHTITDKVYNDTGVTDGVTTIAYDDLGREISRTGSGTSPIYSYYDTFGDYTGYTTKPPGSSLQPYGVTQSITHQQATGLVLQSSYWDNVTSSQRKVDFTYDSAGRIKTKTNGRGTVITYTYDLAGRLTLTDYSDSTPDVSMTYDRAGRVVTITDASGTRNLSYEGGLSGNQANKVSWPSGSPLADWEFNITQEPTGAAAGRRTGWLVKRNGVIQTQAQEGYYLGRRQGFNFAEPEVDTFAEYNVGEQYHQHGERNMIYRASDGHYLGSRQPPGLTNEQNETAKILEWFWAADLDGVAGTTSFMKLEANRWGGGARMTQQHLTRSSSGLNPINVATDIPEQLSVVYDEKGQVVRTTRTFNSQDSRYHIGSGDTTLKAGGSQRWSYDSLGNRVATEISRLGATLTEANADSGAGTEARQTVNYSSNTALNQYKTIYRENPRYQVILGAPIAANVTLLNGTSQVPLTPQAYTLPSGEAGFAVEAAFDALATFPWNPWMLTWRKLRVQVSPTVSKEGWIRFPNSEQLTYDLDGNLVTDSRWTYVWDAENRLVAMEENVISGLTDLSLAPARKRLEFTYDHLGRRVRKLVKIYQAATDSWVTAKDRRFIYDGWNLVAELDSSPLEPGGSTPALELFRSYIWGDDLSGTPQGAGGVGGLVFVQERDLRSARGGIDAKPPAVYAPIYDLNGNILHYVELNRGEGLTHSFEYDAFGRELTRDVLESGTVSGVLESLPFKFSTKYHDEETGLAYYGYRYYSAEMGRWLTKDPIGEKGGLNVYGMLGNDLVNKLDILGLACTCDEVRMQFEKLLEKARSWNLTSPAWEWTVGGFCEGNECGQQAQALVNAAQISAPCILLELSGGSTAGGGWGRMGTSNHHVVLATPRIDESEHPGCNCPDLLPIVIDGYKGNPLWSDPNTSGKVKVTPAYNFSDKYPNKCPCGHKHPAGKTTSPPFIVAPRIPNMGTPYP